MPSLVKELTPLQRMWLYENQRTNEEPYERWGFIDRTSVDDTIFRARPTKAKVQLPRRRDEIALPCKPLKRSEGGKNPPYPYCEEKLTWEESFENLKVYKAAYGDCNVPQKYRENPKLGGWVNKQRKKKKNPAKYGRLSEKQIEKLESIGFIWG